MKNMANEEYTAVPLDDAAGGYGLEKHRARRSSARSLDHTIKVVIVCLVTIVAFILGFVAGSTYQQLPAEPSEMGAVQQLATAAAAGTTASSGLLPPQAFIPDGLYHSTTIAKPR